SGLDAGAAVLGAAGLGAAGLGAATVDAAAPGAAPGTLADTGRPDTSGLDTDAKTPSRSPEPTGPGGQAGPSALAIDAAGKPNNRAAARRAADTAGQAATPFNESKHGRPPRGVATRRRPAVDDEPTTHRSGRRGVRHNGMMAGLLLAPVLVVAL